MPNAVSGVGVVAAAAIRPARFVKIVGRSAGGFAVQECGAGDPVFGVSQSGTQAPPGLIAALGGSEDAVNLPASTNYCATAGMPLTVFTYDDECNLFVGSGGYKPTLTAVSLTDWTTERISTGSRTGP